MHLFIQIGRGTLTASLALVPMWPPTPHDLPVELLLGVPSSYKATFPVRLGCELAVPCRTNRPSIIWDLA